MITIIDSPATTGVPTYKEPNLIYVFSSTETAEDNFKYVVTVNVVGGSEIYKGYFDPNPASRLVFNLSPIVRELLKIDVKEYLSENTVFTLPNTTDTHCSVSTMGSLAIQVEVDEYYGDPPEIVVSGVSVTNIIVDGKFYIKDGYKPSLADYIESFLPNTTKAWWTQRNAVNGEIVIKASDTDYGVVCYSQSNTISFTYKIYNGTTLLATETITADGSAVGDTQNRYMTHFGCYPANLNKAESQVTTKPSTVTWTHYTITRAVGGLFQVASTIKVVNTPHPCKHEPVMVAFHNKRYAGWEFIRFDGRKTNEVTTDSKYYQKSVGTYSASTFSFNSFDRSVQAYHSEESFEYTLKSEALTTEETQLMAGLVASDNVYAYIGGQWLPVEVSTGGITYQTDPISKLQYAEIKIKEA